MTYNNALMFLKDTTEQLEASGFSAYLDGERSPLYPRYIFKLDDMVLGEIGLSHIDPIKDDCGIKWECQWYYMPDPTKGENRGLYRHDIGSWDSVGRFLGEMVYLSIPGEKRKRRDLKIKQLKEERETL